MGQMEKNITMMTERCNEAEAAFQAMAAKCGKSLATSHGGDVSALPVTPEMAVAATEATCQTRLLETLMKMVAGLETKVTAEEAQQKKGGTKWMVRIC